MGKRLPLAARGVEEVLRRKAIQEGGLCSSHASRIHPEEMGDFVSLRRSGLEGLRDGCGDTGGSRTRGPTATLVGRGRTPSCM